MLATLLFDVFGYLRSKVTESCSVLRFVYHWVISYHPAAFFDPPTHWDRNINIAIFSMHDTIL